MSMIPPIPVVPPEIAVEMTLRQRCAWLLDFEPTWFPESCSGLAIFGWALAAFITDDYHITGKAWIFPFFGIAFGPVRWALLLRLVYAPRVICAAIGATWWGWLIAAAGQHWGVVPMMGPMTAVMTLDLLTLARFSIPCWRDLSDDYRAWKASRR